VKPETTGGKWLASDRSRKEGAGDHKQKLGMRAKNAAEGRERKTARKKGVGGWGKRRTVAAKIKERHQEEKKGKKKIETATEKAAKMLSHK